MAKQLGKLTIKELEAALDRRRETADKLQRERERLLARLEQVDRQLADLTGEAPSGAVTSATRKKKGKKKSKKKVAKKKRSKVGARRGQQPTLPDMLAQIMSPSEPKRVGDLAIEVVRRGYKTKSSNLAGQVSTALANDPRFKKVGRGQFVLAQ